MLVDQAIERKLQITKRASQKTGDSQAFLASSFRLYLDNFSFLLFNITTHQEIIVKAKKMSDRYTEAVVYSLNSERIKIRGKTLRIEKGIAIKNSRKNQLSAFFKNL